MTICKNCGAPLHGGKCEYCGTAISKPAFSEIQYVNVEKLLNGVEDEYGIMPQIIEDVKRRREKELADRFDVVTDIVGQKYYFPREDDNGPDSE